MKCKTIILLAAAVLTLAACSEEQLKPRDYTKPAGDRVALTLRAALADGSTMLWDQSARIGIFGSGGTVNVPCSISASSAGTEEGQFYSQVDWTSAGDELYVYYPYNEDNTTAVLSGRLPQTYSQQSLSALNKANMFYAKITDGAPAEGGFKDVGLSPVLAVSSLKLSTATYAGWNLERVSLKSTAGQILSGSYTYDIATDTFTMLTDGTDSIAVNISGEVLGDAGSDVYWLSKSGAAAFNANVEILVSKEGEKSKILTGVASSSAAEAVSMDSFTATEAKDDAIDLSCPDGGTPETANCYVASQAGVTYKFPATVMGNGLTLPPADGYAPSSGGLAPGIVPTALAPASAAVLWQTAPDLIGNVKLKSGYVYFTLKGESGSALTPGNAVIAVWSGPDATGTILWSWHIWVTDADLNVKAQTWKIHASLTEYSSYVNPILMDRNLGALSTDDYATAGSNSAMGLNYQWGRKDPFVGPDNSAYSSLIAVQTYDADGNLIPKMALSATFSNAAKWTHVDTQLSKSDIAAYPMAFVSGSTNYFWLEENIDDLWGCPAFSDASNDIGTKTIYDPCPPGYRVMNAYAMTGVTSNVKGGKFADLASHNILNSSDFSSKHESLHVLCDGSATTAKLPPSGLVFFEKGDASFPFSRVGTYGYIWSAKKASAVYRGVRMHYDTATFTSMENSYGSYGHNVRCEKIK